MPKLTAQVQTFIVTHLACCDSPSEVVRAVKDEFALTVSRQLVQSYDPTRGGRKPAARWCALFDEARERFLEGASSVPIANTFVRLRRLQRIADRAEERGNVKVVLDALRQAAEEVGGLLTNRRELTGADGAPLVVDRSLDDCSNVELATILLGDLTLTDSERSAVIDTLSRPRAAETGAEKARAAEGGRHVA